MDSAYTSPFKDKMAISVVPPPISRIIEPRGSPIGMPAPIAAALASIMRFTLEAPAFLTHSCIARFSTWVEPDGMQTITRGAGRNQPLLWTLRKNCCNIFSVAVRLATTPSRIGRSAIMFPGVRPSICLASSPTAHTNLGLKISPLLLMATTEGSFRTIPLPRA